MSGNSRAFVQKEPRNLNKKNPGKTYLPRFLDQTDTESLKASIDRELADISMYMEQERQLVSKIVPGSDFKGSWDACTDKYPDHGDKDSTWDVVVTCGATHVFDGKTWATGHQLLYLAASQTFVQRTNPGVEGLKQEVDELKVKVDNAEASIVTNRTAIAETNLALAEESKKLTAAIGLNTANITQTNQVVATLTDTVATNKTELESKINDNTSKIAITNTTVANLEKTVSTNKLEMDSSFKSVNDKIGDTDANLAETDKNLAETNSQLAITNQTVADLQGSVAVNVTELRAEYKAADVIVGNNAAADATAKADKVAVDAAAALSITNKTVSDLDKAMSESITNLEAAYKAADSKVAADAAAQLEITNQTVANLEGSMASNVTQLRSEIAAGDTATANKAAADLAITNQTVADNKQVAANATTALKAEMDGNIANINSQMSTVVNKVGTLESKWTVQADVNGKISGIEMVNDGRTSNFTIQTDRFVVTDGSTTRPPFSIESGRVAMKDAIVSGNITADSGNFNNVTIHENCTFLGQVQGNQVKNAKVLMYEMTANLPSGETYWGGTVDTGWNVPGGAWGDSNTTYFVEVSSAGSISTHSPDVCNWHVRVNGSPYINTWWNGTARMFVPIYARVDHGWFNGAFCRIKIWKLL